MGSFQNKVAHYLNGHQRELINTLLPKTLEDMKITFTNRDLDIHFEMLHLLLDRVSKSMLISKEETTENETGYDSLNYFFDKGVLLKQTVAVLSSFRLSLLKFLRQSEIIDKSEMEQGLEIYEDIIFAFDEAIRMTTQKFNDQAEIAQFLMDQELDDVTAPIVCINNTHAVMPLVGKFSPSRMNNLLHNTIRQASLQHVQKLIIDFSGVLNFDKELGILLFDLFHGLKMQGIEVVITGIAPNMAKTITELSLDFSNLKLYGNLKQALSR
ncbi:STAS domain-containing protein [Fictibacillus fluitans]|uniref:STAS domain-containing protein n=1 Tax=Fictibacillus fluitans TaxID=3058422 RepID=A0ABT8HRC1_9BACL|nr:STAS domain-containing protein [Fictibacillus sp. NE201]MDN4523317.1 STAS domain-containing protein [Fictibacillus sp. NE201]